MSIINLASEAIAFQSTLFRDSAIALMEKIYTKSTPAECDKCEEKKELESLINSTTGLGVQLRFNTDSSPCTLPFLFNPKSIFSRTGVDTFSSDRTNLYLHFNDAEKIRLSIDLDNAKVGGDFKDLPVPVYMGMNFLKKYQITPAEAVAILAHEIGHCFVALEMCVRRVTTNQILANISKAHAKGDRGKYEFQIKNACKYFNIDSGVTEEALMSKDAESAMLIILSDEASNPKSRLKSDTYDVTTFEALSDNFATRMHLYKELVSGLHKLSAFDKIPGRALLVILLSLSLVSLAMNVYWMSPVGIVTGIINNAILVIKTDESAEWNNIYDKLPVRYKRIKEQLINYLKTNKLPDEEVDRTLAAIEEIEKHSRYVTSFPFVHALIARVVFPSTREHLRNAELQRHLEELASNDLYVRGAQLKLLSA